MDAWLWPQWTVAGMYAFGIVCAAAMDGESKTGKHSFAISVVSAGFGVWILYCGGFWK